MTGLIFTKFTLVGQLFVNNSYAEFYETPTNNLGSHTRSQKEGRTVLVTASGILFLTAPKKRHSLPTAV